MPKWSDPQNSFIAWVSAKINKKAFFSHWILIGILYLGFFVVEISSFIRPVPILDQPFTTMLSINVIIIIYILYAYWFTEVHQE